MIAENKVKAGTAGGIEAVVKAMNTHINNANVCKNGCSILWNIYEGNTTVQKEVCKKGVLDVLLRILKEHSNNQNILGSCCGAVGVVLSSPEVYSKFCTQVVIRTVEECYNKHRDSEQIKQFLLGLKREEDPRVCDSVARGVCTKEAFPKCGEDCGCDENYYCYKCCVQQKAFRCLTCDKDKIKFY